MPQNPWPVDTMRSPRMQTAMSSQYAKWLWIAAALTASLAARFRSVSSERTTPQPKVSSGALRSNTVISWAGLRSLRLTAK